MKRSEIKTADYASGEYFKVSVLKISARSDEFKGWLYVRQFGALHEKLVLRKMQKNFEKFIVTEKG